MNLVHWTITVIELNTLQQKGKDKERNDNYGQTTFRKTAMIYISKHSLLNQIVKYYILEDVTSTKQLVFKKIMNSNKNKNHFRMYYNCKRHHFVEESVGQLVSGHNGTITSEQITCNKRYPVSPRNNPSRRRRRQ